MKGSSDQRDTQRKGQLVRTLFLSVIPLMVPLAFGQDTNPVPIATQWLYDAVAPGSKGTVDSIVRIRCLKTGMVGSGFILTSGYVITNHHVIEHCGAADLEVVSSLAVTLPIENLWSDPKRDLAALKPRNIKNGIFMVEPSRTVLVGTQLSAWGYPFAHPGPAPLLTVGYLSGFTTISTINPVKHLIVNGAFNPGNSGGPLISPDGTIVGVVVAKKLIELSPEGYTALTVLKNNQSGVMYGATKDGKQISVSESQVIAMVLADYQRASQVFIGYAVAASELTVFLDSLKIPWSLPAKKGPPAAETLSTVQRKKAKLQ